MTSGRLSDAISENVKQEIQLSELRTRNWVLAGLLTNMIGWVPVIFFLGSMHRDIADSIEQQKAMKVTMQVRGEWITRRNVWESSATQWMTAKGWRPPQAPPPVDKEAE